ncbi:MAG: L-fuconate dehydratase [Bryobacteraceae bacterium]
MNNWSTSLSITITRASASDIRFPTSKDLIGSDSVHVDPDYSAAYVILETNVDGLEGHGLTFTIGRGNDLCVAAIEALSAKVVGRTLDGIVNDMRAFYRSIAQHSQLRWVGPEKGVIHLATAALINAVWDLWAKSKNKPLWKLLVGLDPEHLVSAIDFQYITDALTPEEALTRLRSLAPFRGEREAEILESGYPAYNTSVGWLGYSEDKVRQFCRDALAAGWTHFKMKVGADLETDARRAALIRDTIGFGNKLMMDANQRWDVGEAITHIKQLAEFEPWFFEEPTSPDDVLGYQTIARAVAPVRLACGEHAQNRVIFKQLMQAGAIGVCQIDSCRVGSVNENLAIILMAAKFGIPVCPHAGGVGLCEYVQHLSLVDYIAVTGTTENRVTEYVDHLHEHFETPCVVKNGRYFAPTAPGYSINMKAESRERYRYPDGAAWRE